MKHTIAFLFFLLITTLFTLAQSETKFGIKTGANLSIFSASINSDVQLKPGFHIGVYMRHGKNEKFHVRTELYFSSQGQKDNYVLGNGSASLGSTETTINAINLPVLFEMGRRVTFQLGPQFGFLLSGREKGTVSGQKVDDDLKDSMNPMDISVVAGMGIYIKENFNLGVRGNLGLTSVFDRPTGAPSDYPNICNRVIHLYVGYTF